MVRRIVNACRQYGFRFLVWGGALSVALSSSSAFSAEQEVGLSVIKTGSSAGAQEAMVVSTGSFFKRRYLTHNVILITHPKGDMIIDTGLGQDIDEQFQENGFLDRQLLNYDDANPAVLQMKAEGYDPANLTRIVPTHLHWDHAGGIEDFPGVPVLVQKAEYEQAMNGEAPAFLRSQMDAKKVNWEFIEFTSNSIKGFERSIDLYGDGSVILVDISGHTAGQVGVFLTLSSGKRFFFIGDTTWTLKGVIDNAERPAFLSWMIKFNWDDELNLNRIAAVHALLMAEPDITIVPAHDELVSETMPKFPAFIY